MLMHVGMGPWHISRIAENPVPLNVIDTTVLFREPISKTEIFHKEFV